MMIQGKRDRNICHHISQCSGCQIGFFGFVWARRFMPAYNTQMLG